MKTDYLGIMACPACGANLSHLLNPEESGSGGDLCCASGHRFPILRNIPRFVGPENYATNFGFQWNKHRMVQLDSFNGSDFSKQRFAEISGWTAADLSGRLVLDAGCGAGRFAEVVSNYGAKLVAVDLSSAIEAASTNLAARDAFFAQASIYELPFKPAVFDFVYSIGVIQHTPDPEKAIRSLCRLVKIGGQLALWIYERNWKAFIGTVGFKYALRPLTRNLPPQTLYAYCEAAVQVCYPVLSLAKKRGPAGKVIMRLLPVSSAHLQIVPLKPADFKEWVLLDTFDMYSPAFDHPQKYLDVVKILTSEGFEHVQRHPHGAIAVTAKRVR